MCTGDTCVSRSKIWLGLLGRQIGEENSEINNLHIKGEGANLKVCPCAQIFLAMLLSFSQEKYIYPHCESIISKQ